MITDSDFWVAWMVIDNLVLPTEGESWSLYFNLRQVLTGSTMGFFCLTSPRGSTGFPCLWGLLREPFSRLHRGFRLQILRCFQIFLRVPDTFHLKIRLCLSCSGEYHEHSHSEHSDPLTTPPWLQIHPPNPVSVPAIRQGMSNVTSTRDYPIL